MEELAFDKSLRLREIYILFHENLTNQLILNRYIRLDKNLWIQKTFFKSI